jgi:hypothetical protein
MKLYTFPTKVRGYSLALWQIMQSSRVGFVFGCCLILLIGFAVYLSVVVMGIFLSAVGLWHA